MPLNIVYILQEIRRGGNLKNRFLNYKTSMRNFFLIRNKTTMHNGQDNVVLVAIELK